ncbi:gamma-glutamyltransferase family protein [Naumannella halotolerans]|uniref:Gamma-glutamyltranspeptidase/glutathione hydrolase n=1 Tax=Naumannella halotolerans TaxID=993414 RepID=A0A4V3ENF6_9ACTN|nr:gamma-glutamyltransferase [Naumannella halotolerans]TDT33608.1 gamma-glutamyltranspeptidase/glutathione hydrolase [Naumannella halotolerans]
MRAPKARPQHHRSMIVTPQPEATDAGAVVLAEGGNAVDAAVAAALVQGVVDPLMCGVGGFALMQLRLPDGTQLIIDGLGTCPSGISDGVWAEDLLGITSDGFGFRVRDFVNETGPQAVMTPGTLRTLMQAHDRFGSLPWSDLFAEAIRLARTGWPVRPHVQTVLIQNEAKYGRMDFADKLGVTADGRRIYRPEGALPRLGDLVVNPELAETLELIAERGGEDFHRGELAGVIVDSIARDGGFLSAEDLADYVTIDREPLRADYRGLTLCAPPSPGGGHQLLQTLGILARFPLGELVHNSADHLQILTEAMKRAMGDREALWNSASVTDADYDALLEPAGLDAAAAAIRAGDRYDLEAGRVSPQPAESQHTTHLNVIDADGLTVALSHTLGNPSGYIPRGTGFILNGGMSTFDPRPGRTNSIAPGLRRNSTMSPTIVLSEDEPVMAVGAPGASWITPGITQAISNVLDFGMSAAEAVSAPRAVATSNAIDISNRIPRRTETALIAQGYQVRRSALSYAFAGVHLITRFDDGLRGGADPQRDGYAAGIG